MTRRMPPWEYINYKLMHSMHMQMHVVNSFEVAFDYGVIRAGVRTEGFIGFTNACLETIPTLPG
jgi:hypothetical protein